ncbi:MAG TPA: toll/interleukin-1 receptor domain-containing protein, partial [Chryseosolibacter sp.]|nr:toll/interleukin-1 receptor domain-containing protein [Chryseosolibacter sp.]
MRQNKYEYDAFISHAVEDKIPIANELCAKLESAGLRIWYSGKELGVGDSIEKTIEKGLHRSRYGIVILSPTYLAKNWTIREFYTLLAKEIEEQKVILPVLYNVTVDDLKNKDLLMADRFAVNADRGLDFVVSKLVSEIKKPKVAEPKTAWLSRIWVVLIASLLANLFFLLRSDMFSPDGEYRLSAEEATRPVQNQF